MSYHKLVRATTAFYVAHFPVEKGKGRLLSVLKPLLRKENETAVVETSFKCKMELQLADHVQERIYFFGAYERPLVEYLLAKLTRGMVFADVGSQVGQFALLAAKFVGPEGRVHAFEPSAESFARLNRNVQLNNFENVTCHNYALGDSEGQAQLYINKQSAEELNTGTNSLRRKAAWTDAESVTVGVRMIDNVLGQCERLDIMKIDVEGAELPVLRGAKKTILRFKPIIAVEAEEGSAKSFGYSTRDLKAYLEDLGYELFRIPREGKHFSLVKTTSSESEEFSMLIGVSARIPAQTARAINEE